MNNVYNKILKMSRIMRNYVLNIYINAETDKLFILLGHYLQSMKPIILV